MYRILICFLAIFCAIISCKKDTIDNVSEPLPQSPKPHKIKIVFVNRLGFKNDSVSYGATYRAFQGPCIDSKFYNKVENKSYLSNTCYNRNFPPDNFPTQDSVLFREFEYSNESLIAIQIELRWWLRYSADQSSVVGLNAKILRYTSRFWPNGDTIKVARDTVIKFIWPDDTASGRFIKTYQWP